LSIVF